MKKNFLILLVFIVCFSIFSSASAGPEDVRFVPLTRLSYKDIDSYGWYKKCADTAWVGIELHNIGNQDCVVSLPNQAHVASNGGIWYPLSNFRYKELDRETTSFDGVINKEGIVAGGINFTGSLTLPAGSIYAVFFDVSGISAYSLYWDTYIFYTIALSSGSASISKDIVGGLSQRGNGCGDDKVCSAEVLRGEYSPNGSGNVTVRIKNNMPDGAAITALNNVILSWKDNSGEQHSQTVTDGVVWSPEPGWMSGGSQKEISGTLHLPVDVTAANRKLTATFSFHHPSSLFFGNFSAEAELESKQGIQGVISGNYLIDGSGSFTAAVYNYQDTAASITLPASGTVSTSDNITSSVTLAWSQSSPVTINSQGKVNLSGTFQINDTSLIHSNSSLVLSADLRTSGNVDGAAAGTVTRNAGSDAFVTSVTSNFCRNYRSGSKTVTFRYVLKNESSIDIPVDLATTLAVEGHTVNPIIRYTDCISGGSSCFSRIRDNKITLTAGETASFYGEASLSNTLSKENFSIATSLIYRPDGIRKVLYVGYTTSECGEIIPTTTATAVTPTAETPTAVTPTAVTPTSETPTAVTPTAETPTAVTPTAETPTATAVPELITTRFCRDYYSGSKTLTFVYALKNNTASIIPVQLATTMAVEGEPKTLPIRYTKCESSGSSCSSRISQNKFNLYPGETAAFHGIAALTRHIQKQDFQIKTSLLYTVNGERKAYYVGAATRGCSVPTETATAVTPTAETPTAVTPTAETPTAETPTAVTPTAETPTATAVPELITTQFCRDYYSGSKTLTFVYALKNNTASIIPVQLATTLAVEGEPKTLPIRYTKCESGGGSCSSRISQNKFNLYPGETAAFHGVVTLTGQIQKQDFQVKTSLLYTVNGETKPYYVGAATRGCSVPTETATAVTPTAETPTAVTPTAETPTATAVPELITTRFCRDYYSGSKTLTFVYALKNNTASIIPVQLAATMSVEGEPKTLPIRYTKCESGGGSCSSRISQNKFNLYPGETAAFHGSVTLTRQIQKQDFQIKTSLLYTVNGERKAYYVGAATRGCSVPTETATAVTPTAETPTAVTPTSGTPTATAVPELITTRFCRDYNFGSKTLTFVYALKNNTASIIPVQLATTLSVEGEPKTLPIRYTKCESGGGSCSSRISRNKFNLYPGETAAFHGSVTLTQNIQKQNFWIKTSLLYTANGETKAYYIGKTSDACTYSSAKAAGTDIDFNSITFVSEDNSQATMMVQINNHSNTDACVIPGTVYLHTAALTDYEGLAIIDPHSSHESFAFSSDEPIILSGQSSAELYLTLYPAPSYSDIGEAPINWNFSIENENHNVTDMISFSKDPSKNALSSPTNDQNDKTLQLFTIGDTQMMPELPATGFSAHADNSAHSIRQGSLNYQSLDGLNLEIPSLSTSTQLVSIPLDDNNEWSVEWLDERAGVLQGSELPGKGTAIIAAHNHLSQTTTGPFANIHQLAAGDRIFVTDRFGNMLRYKVYENELVKPDSIKALYQAAIPGSIILVTCENEQLEGGYTDRRVVYAEPMQ